jgi:hypothetical protein
MLGSIELVSKLSLAKVTSLGVALIAATMSLTPPVASASSPMPLSAKWRACDFSQAKWVDATGYARPVAYVGPSGDGSVVAKVDMATALPNTSYAVRVIQMPRASIGCAPGDPGVIAGSLTTDGAGAGSVTLQGPVASGKTGAWVVVERAASNSQTPAEFYTSEFIASI